MLKRITILSAVALAAACSNGPGEECTKWLDCMEALDNGVSVTAYEEGGSCWETADTAKACEDACKTSNGVNKDIADAPDACK